MAEELKPCPFCGSRAAQLSTADTSWVECVNQNCDATVSGSASLWNTRAESPEMRAIRSALKIMGDNSESCRRIALTNDCDKFNERHATYRMSIRIILEQLTKEGVTQRQKSPGVNPER